MKTLIVLLMLVALLSGCATDQWQVSTGPLWDTGKNADNSDIPWIIDARVPLKAFPKCSIGVTHISSIKGGPPYYVGGKDNYLLTAFSPACRFGPGV